MHVGSGMNTHGLLVDLKIHFADATAKTSSRNSTSWMDQSPGMEPSPLSTWGGAQKLHLLSMAVTDAQHALGSLFAFIDGRQETMGGHYAFK